MTAPIADPPERTRVSLRQIAFAAARVALALAAGSGVAVAALAPELPLASRALALVTFSATLWRPHWGLLIVVGLAPVGALLAEPPARYAELLAWAFFAGWGLRVWEPAGKGLAGLRLIVTPTLLYLAAVVSSLLGLIIGGAAGVEPASLAAFLLQAFPGDYLVFSSPEPETWHALPAAAGIGLLLAGAVCARADERLAAWVARAAAGGAVAAALLTILGVFREFAAHGYGGWYLLRYLRGERFSLHLTDLNAAGSHFVLGGMLCLGAVAAGASHRTAWALAGASMLPALWLTGSRAAIFAGLLVALLLFPATLAARHSRWHPSRRQVATALALCAGIAVVALLAASIRRGGEAESGMTVRLRAQFLQTSARMFASAPLTGVGVGRYYERSADFMPPTLKEIYGHENAHNYFAQQFAELGVAGGTAFMWLIAAAMALGWRALGGSPVNAVRPALLCATSAYVLTAVTGHPFLVPETALPFWIVLGAMVAGAPARPRAPRTARWMAAATGLILAIATGTLLWRASNYADTSAVPVERGFHGFETASDGTRYRWTTRHAVAYIGPGQGFLTIPLRAPGFLQRDRPFIVEVALAGRVVARQQVPADRWLPLTVLIRDRTRLPYRRVDLRVNQVWTPKRDLGYRVDDRPMGVMLGDMRFEPAGR